jgi:hypothetical protein
VIVLIVRMIEHAGVEGGQFGSTRAITIYMILSWR